MADFMVNVYENEECVGEIIARVKYNEDLDYWDGRNHTNGGSGMHKGLTKLKDGRFVIIIGSQWQGSIDYAYIVTDDEALQQIMRSDNMDLLDRAKYASLKELFESSLIEEEE